MSVAPIAEGDCHVWLAPQPEVLPEALASTWKSWLAPEEHARLARFRFPRHRDQYLLTRALVRTTLSTYADVAPGAWRFVEGTHGKPELAMERPCSLAFNLSNTDGLAVCAVTSGAEVGVDVEDVERPGETLSVASRYFSEREVEELFALPPEERRERFFRYWTLKEAYIKARGLGLAIPLESFSFASSPWPRVCIELEPASGDADASSWQFASLRQSPRHLLAVAVRQKAPLVPVLREAFSSSRR